MGVPSRELEYNEMYVPRSSFELEEDPEAQLSAYNKFRRFYPLYRYMQKAGKRFWDIKVRDETDIEGYIEILQSATRTIPEIDQTIKSATYKPPQDLADEAKDNLIHLIPDFSVPANKKGRRPTLDITYADAHDMPEIRLETMKRLEKQDDMAMEVVKLFEGWRYANNPIISDLQTENARRAYEMYFFSVGSAGFIYTLGRTATELYQK